MVPIEVWCLTFQTVIQRGSAGGASAHLVSLLTCFLGTPIQGLLEQGSESPVCTKWLSLSSWRQAPTQPTTPQGSPKLGRSANSPCEANSWEILLSS